MKYGKLAWWLLKATGKVVWEATVTTVEAGFWAGALTKDAIVKTTDACRAAKHLRGLRCPQGHLIETEPGPFECRACGYAYMGSIYKCGNPECAATSPYVNCPTCGLSVRNPWRWGRP